MDRAYAVLEVKAIGDGGRRFTGLATTISPDRLGDVVVPKGAQFTLPMPLLWNHKADQPIGWVRAARVRDDAIEIDAEIHAETEAGALKDRCDEAWQSIRAGLVRGLSIGMRPIDAEPIKGSHGVRWKQWDWLETSAVVLPANAEASIRTIKSIDEQQLAAIGEAPPIERPPPGVSGSTKQPASRGFSFARKDDPMKTIAEQIASLEAARAAKTARMAEVMQKAMDEGRSTDEAEAEEYDGLSLEVKRADEDLKRLRVLEQLNIEKAKVVEQTPSTRGPIILRSNRDRDEAFPGQNFTRKIIAKAAARLDDTTATHVAMERWGKTNPTLVEIIKAGEVPGGGTGSGEWGAELVAADARYTGDFIEFLYGRTVFDRLGLREVPPHVTIKGQDGASTAYWVGESKAIPVTVADFMSVTLVPHKVAALAVVSNELIRYSSPAAEMLVRDSLVEASAQRIDTTFLGTGAAVAGVSPAGILNGLTGITPAGTDADSLRADVRSLYAPFITAKNAAAGLIIVTTPSLAKSVQLMVNALGQAEFPNMRAADGNLLGDPVITGDNVPSGAVILLRPSDIYRIGDTGVQVMLSRDAAIEQNSSPTGATDTPVGVSQAWTSMFQEDSTAIRVIRHVSWAKRRASAVAFVTGAAYVG